MQWNNRNTAVLDPHESGSGWVRPIPAVIPSEKERVDRWANEALVARLLLARATSREDAIRLLDMFGLWTWATTGGEYMRWLRWLSSKPDQPAYVQGARESGTRYARPISPPWPQEARAWFLMTCTVAGKEKLYRIAWKGLNQANARETFAAWVAGSQGVLDHDFDYNKGRFDFNPSLMVIGFNCLTWGEPEPDESDSHGV